ncbi:MAG TPA: DsrE family protein [Balneolales bacterium]|nr:DsrE family protein [Balneolales bacterium]
MDDKESRNKLNILNRGLTVKMIITSHDHLLPAILIMIVSLVFSYQTVIAQNSNKPGTAKSSQPNWIYPVIQNVGGVHPRPNLPVRPNPKVDYKIFVDIVSSDRDPSGQFKGLKRLARLVNLMAYGKVPADHVHIIAVLDGESGYASAINAFYQKQFKANNPNLPILHALKKAGVTLMICSQALAEHGMPDKIVDPDVTITLSALIDAVVYGQKGYTYMQL